MKNDQKEVKTLSDLSGNTDNPRIMRQENAKYLQASIERFGDLSGTVYNIRTGHLVTGHQRKAVVEKMIGENPEIIYTQKFENPTAQYTVAHGYMEVKGERFQVRFVDMSPEIEAAANLVANSVFNQGEDDLELMPLMLDLADKSGMYKELGLDLVLDSLDLGDIDFDEKESSEDKKTKSKETLVKCPNCGHDITV